MKRETTRSMVAASLIVIWLCAGVPIVVAQQERQRKRTDPGEFVCYTDAVVTEKHAGVSSAEEKVSGPAWKITYAEGGYAVYAQREGESCQFEMTN